VAQVVDARALDSDGGAGSGRFAFECSLFFGHRVIKSPSVVFIK
jgi:hypothetical protein